MRAEEDVAGMVLKRPGSRDLRTEEDSIERMKNDG